MATILEMKDITKEFPGVKALDNVNLKVEEGTIHAICGENGAGKSTLMNVLSGVYPYGTYDGDIVLEGKVSKFQTVNDSQDQGIGIIHQELALVPTLSIKENMYLGNERQTRGIIDWNKTLKDSRKYLELVGLDEDPDVLINRLGVGKQQLVEIAKALSKNVKLLILDEPTAALNEDDSYHLLELLLKLKEQGVTSIIISHKLNEINEYSDEVTIIRDGESIETLSKAEGNISEDRIIRGMVGRKFEDLYPEKHHEIGDVIFEIKDWNVASSEIVGQQSAKNINMNIRQGEVVGIAGLVGAGRTELAMSIFGKSYGRFLSGTMYKDGQEIQLNNPREAIEARIIYLTEDRKAQGLILDQTIRENTTIANLPGISNQGIIDGNHEIEVAQDYFDRLGVRAPGIESIIGNLSGGNQQKVMLARGLYADPDLLILDEPTRGIDVGAKQEIYRIINQLASDGKSILIISSELPEVLGLSDRVYVMNEGEFIAEFSEEEASQEAIMEAIVTH